MKVTTERLENCQVHVFVELDAADVDQRLRQTARKISRKFTVPGYRRGKAPFQAVVRVFGREAIQEEALDEFGQDLYEKALEQIEYQPYQAGELKEVEWDPFRMTILLPIRPEVDLGDYRSVRVPFEQETVTDEQVDDYITYLRRQQAQWVPVDRPAALGDQVVVDTVGRVGDDSIFTHDNYEMVLSEDASYPLPGFHEQVVGMSAAEERSFALFIPEGSSRQELVGQEAQVSVRLQGVKEQDLPPVDDELAMMVGDYETLAELKAAVREALEAEAAKQSESQYRDSAIDAIIEAAPTIEYPPQAIERETEGMIERMESNLSSSGMQLDTYLGMLGKTRETYKQEVAPSAERRLRRRLVLEQIALQEGLKVEDAEIESTIDAISDTSGGQSEEMRQMLESPLGRLSVADDLLMDKAWERIAQIARGEAPPLPAEPPAEGPALAADTSEPETEAPGMAPGEDDGAPPVAPTQDAEPEAIAPEPPAVQDSAGDEDRSAAEEG
jgi:trigger factor